MTTPLMIIRVVFDYFGISSFYQMTKTRKREIVIARQVSMYYIKENTRLSLANIGAYFLRDHATVMHACKTVNNLRDTDRKFRSDMVNICNKIQCKILEGRPAINEYAYSQYDTDRV
jgi:chromosomal replication initiator protein